MILQSNPSAANQIGYYLLNLGEELVVVAVITAVVAILFRLIRG
jgi:hypothetical protein